MSGPPRVSVAERLDRNSIPEPNSGCYLWIGGGERYGHIEIGDVQDLAHRVAWQYHRGEIPDGMFVCHKCDVGFCINPDHLFLGSHADNMEDRERKGRTAKGLRCGAYTKPERRAMGERNCNAKLTAATVIEIRRSGESNQAAAKRYGVTANNIAFVRARATWRHVA